MTIHNRSFLNGFGRFGMLRWRSEDKMVKETLTVSLTISLTWAKPKPCFFPFPIRIKQTHRLLYTLPTNIYLSVDVHNIVFVNEFRLLGVNIDNNLHFDSYIYNIITKVNSKTFILLKNLKSFQSFQYYFILVLCLKLWHLMSIVSRTVGFTGINFIWILFGE